MPRIIKALLKKDAALFMSNRFYMLITVVGIVFYIGIYFVLPSKVDEKLSLAMYAPVVSPVFTQLTNHEGVGVEYFSGKAPNCTSVRLIEMTLIYNWGLCLGALPANVFSSSC